MSRSGYFLCVCLALSICTSVVLANASSRGLSQPGGHKPDMAGADRSRKPAMGVDTVTVKSKFNENGAFQEQENYCDTYLLDQPIVFAMRAKNQSNHEWHMKIEPEGFLTPLKEGEEGFVRDVEFEFSDPQKSKGDKGPLSGMFGFKTQREGTGSLHLYYSEGSHEAKYSFKITLHVMKERHTARVVGNKLAGQPDKKCILPFLWSDEKGNTVRAVNCYPYTPEDYKADDPSKPNPPTWCPYNEEGDLGVCHDPCLLAGENEGRGTSSGVRYQYPAYWGAYRWY
eukprot:GFYU01010311.1.p1 GENE.GFYU01010311.1~~GFYU01010311.1.p1  ORF type:complete len:284 (+),score=68.99 GFYU01010311.1:22-873(+)